MTMGKTFQNKTYRESCADYKSVRKRGFESLLSKKNPKNTFKSDTLQIFNLKQLYLNKEWSKSHNLLDL